MLWALCPHQRQRGACTCGRVASGGGGAVGGGALRRAALGVGRRVWGRAFLRRGAGRGWRLRGRKRERWRQRWVALLHYNLRLYDVCTCE